MKSIVENNIVLNGNQYKYVICYKKIKNIYFRVKDDLVIYVSCNKLTSQNYIHNLLLRNEKELLRLIEKANLKSNKNNDIYYLGNKLDYMMYVGAPFLDDNSIYARTLDEAREFLFKKAYDVFLSRLKSIMIRFDNLPEFTLKVRKMTSKWGVCNKRSMTVTLNVFLIEKDVHLIDYVIIHELCHFKYMDHSASFWKYVESFYPYYKRARKELNSYD